MIIIMKQGTTHEHVDELSRHIERWNVKANPIYGEGTIVIGLVGDTGAVDKDALMLDPQVENIIKVQEPFKLANRKFHPDNSVVEIAPGVAVGGKKLVVMAGPCSVESEEQIIDVAKHVQADGAAVLRGGAWKPRSSPYSFQGLKAEGLELLHKAHEATGLPVVTEITNPAHIDISWTSATASRSARATCRILSCSRNSARPASPSCSSAASPTPWRSS